MSDQDRGTRQSNGPSQPVSERGHTWTLRAEGASPIASLSFGPGSHVLGSASDADLALPDPAVSRHHARIDCGDDGVTIEDLQSTNGTFVDDARIDAPVALRAGVRVRFGGTLFRLVPLAESSSEETDTVDGAQHLLGTSTIGFLRGRGDEVAYAEGDSIVHRGDHQSFFFVVVSGEVELSLHDQEGGPRRRPLARLGPGATFGAESVLSDSGAAVDAVAITDVRLLRYPASALSTALKESASLREKLLGGIAQSLHRAAADALDLLKGTDVIVRLVQGDDELEELISTSNRMKALQKRLQRSASLSGPVLIVGEAGTGKTLAARWLHRSSARAGGPLIAVNCRRLSPDHAAALILGEESVRETGTESHGSGGVHLAHGGTLLLRDADALPPAVQERIAQYLEWTASRPPGLFPDTRIVATARSAAQQDDPARGLSGRLIDRMGDLLQLPTLADRPRDILPLAEALLARTAPDPPRLAESGRHALLSLRYEHRNVAELRDVIELAARCAEGSEIRSEHVFGGFGEEAALPGVDVTGSRLLRGLVQGGGIARLRALVAVSFFAVVLVCLLAGSSFAGRLANSAIWTAWEPLVFAMFLLAGPVWCTVCPLSMAARFAQRFSRPERAPPGWIVRHGPWLTVVGFAAIVWSERSFRMLENPTASGLLLLTLAMAAILVALAFRREVWCRHLCPLGRLAVALAPASPLQLTARRSVCASSCLAHECFKGTPEVPGCTVFHHPLDARRAHRCKLCLDCLRSCPHGSTRLQVRAPLRAVWRLDGSATGVALFAASLPLLSLVLFVPLIAPALAAPIPFAGLCLLAIIGGSGLHYSLRRLGGGSDGERVLAAQVAFALVLCGWGALMAVQAANVPLIADARLLLPLPGWLQGSGAVDLAALPVVQGLLVAASCALGIFTLGRIRANAPQPDTVLPSPRRWRMVQLGFVLYGVVVMVLIRAASSDAAAIVADASTLP